MGLAPNTPPTPPPLAQRSSSPPACTPRAQYATNHLTVFLARVATSLDLTRHRSEVSGNTIYLPTLYPGDSVFGMKWAYPDAAMANAEPEVSTAAA